MIEPVIIASCLIINRWSVSCRFIDSSSMSMISSCINWITITSTFLSRLEDDICLIYLKISAARRNEMPKS